MKDSAWNDEVDRRTGERLDADTCDGQPPVDPELDEAVQARAADFQLVEALLSNMSSQAAAEKADRIQRVMDAIDDNQVTRTHKQRFRAWQSIVAIAASVMVAFGLLWSQFAQDTRASEVLREIGEVAMESIDRMYYLRRDVAASKVAQPVEGELYLRGRDGFVLRSGNTVLGRNADEYWLVEQDGEVLVADSFEWMVAESQRGQQELELLKELSVDSRKVPLMQLSSVVELMQHDYQVTLQSNLHHREHPVDQIVGTLREATSKLPYEIRLWSGADSRIIHRAELSWGSGDSLVLELAPPKQVPADWYSHEAHHPDQQPVRRVSQDR